MQHDTVRCDHHDHDILRTFQCRFVLKTREKVEERLAVLVLEEITFRYEYSEP